MFSCGLLGFLAIHFECFFERGLQIFQELFPGVSLGINAGHFLDPANPEVSVPLNCCCVLIHE